MSSCGDISEPDANPFQGVGDPLSSRAELPGRSVWRILSAAAFVVLAGVVILAGFLLSTAIKWRWVPHCSVAAAVAVYGVGFAIYDYRGPFGPRPSSRRGK
jgi:hypothetical protein